MVESRAIFPEWVMGAVLPKRVGPTLLLQYPAIPEPVKGGAGSTLYGSNDPRLGANMSHGHQHRPQLYQNHGPSSGTFLRHQHSLGCDSDPGYPRGPSDIRGQAHQLRTMEVGPRMDPDMVLSSCLDQDITIASAHSYWHGPSSSMSLGHQQGPQVAALTTGLHITISGNRSHRLQYRPPWLLQGLRQRPDPWQ